MKSSDYELDQKYVDKITYIPTREIEETFIFIIRY